jgi:hypothetical protein
VVSSTRALIQLIDLIHSWCDLLVRRTDAFITAKNAFHGS